MAEPSGPLGRMPTIEGMVAPAYALLRTDAHAGPVDALWLVLHSAMQVARDADQASEPVLAQALGAALGELIADLPGPRQQDLVQAAIHHAFAYADQLRTPGFDQPHGAHGHA